MKKTGRQMPDKLPERVISELAAIGLTRATDVLSLDDDRLTLKTGEKIDPACGAAIASVEKTPGGWKIKLYDKLKALELLGTYLGMSGAEEKTEKNNLLEAILSSTREAIDTSDIQELQ